MIFNKHCLRPEVFMNIEYFKKMCRMNVLGQSLVISAKDFRIITPD